jgi:hypothetical protein
MNLQALIRTHFPKSFLPSISDQKLAALEFQRVTLRTWDGIPTDGIIYPAKKEFAFEGDFDFLPLLQTSESFITAISLDSNPLALQFPYFGKNTAFYFPDSDLRRKEYMYGKDISSQQAYLERKNTLAKYNPSIAGPSLVIAEDFSEDPDAYSF